MVDLRATSDKLRERARAMLMLLIGIDYAEAEQVLAAAGGELKTAIVMRVCRVDAQEAQARLAAARGQLRAVVGDHLIPKNEG